MRIAVGWALPTNLDCRQASIENGVRCTPYFLLCAVVIFTAIWGTGCTVGASNSSQTYDVVVYGGTSAAVAAAV
ncbi:MAG: hypothetical protein JXN61_01440, partial [Sedimentisphaerales bacterium]|nr:hypothetical protein [Sedimentisphaerales bacterium]